MTPHNYADISKTSHGYEGFQPDFHLRRRYELYVNSYGLNIIQLKAFSGHDKHSLSNESYQESPYD